MESFAKKLKDFSDQPFTLFFPLGIFMGFIFIGCWPAFVVLKNIPYPGTLHAFGIISLFIGSFAVGFLLTAIPRFTATEKATPTEIFLLFVTSCLELAALLFVQQVFALLTFLKLLQLLVFVAKRAMHAEVQIPATFSWVILGILSGFIGILGYALASFIEPLQNFMVLYRALFLRGFLTGLLMGIGGRLVPFLTNIGDGVIKSESSHTSHRVCSLIFFISLVLENTWPGFERLFLLTQSLAILYEILFIWKLHKLPSKGARSVGLWLSAWNLVIGMFLAALFYNHKVHFMHLAFVGGFAMATLAVASHVKVAHLSFNPKKLVHFWPLGLVLTLVWLATITRMVAPFSSYLNHLAYSAGTLCLALIIWSLAFRKS